jgi:hypothetical protein
MGSKFHARCGLRINKFFHRLFPFAGLIELPKHLGIGKSQKKISYFECMNAS